MSDTQGSDPDKPFDAQVDLVVGQAAGTTCFSHSLQDCLQQMPSPGIVIFVHGVNSDGEWYQAAEAGLCKGLNTRLKRCDEHLCHASPQAGQLTPVGYCDAMAAAPPAPRAAASPCIAIPTTR